jgi:hypothetical protein
MATKTNIIIYSATLSTTLSGCLFSGCQLYYPMNNISHDFSRYNVMQNLPVLVTHDFCHQIVIFTVLLFPSLFPLRTNKSIFHERLKRV